MALLKKREGGRKTRNDQRTARLLRASLRLLGFYAIDRSTPGTSVGAANFGVVAPDVKGTMSVPIDLRERYPRGRETVILKHRGAALKLVQKI